MKNYKNIIDYLLIIFSSILLSIILFSTYKIIDNKNTEVFIENAKFIESKNKSYGNIDYTLVNNIKELNTYNNSILNEKNIANNKEDIIKILDNKFIYKPFFIFERENLKKFSLIEKNNNFFIKNNNNVAYSFIYNDNNWFKSTKENKFIYKDKIYEIFHNPNSKVISIFHNFKFKSDYFSYDFKEEIYIKDNEIKYSNTYLEEFYNIPKIKVIYISENKAELLSLYALNISSLFLLILSLSYRRKHFILKKNKKEQQKEIKINDSIKIEIKK